MIRLISALGLGLALVLGAACAKNDAGPTYPVVGTVDQTKMEQGAFAARSAYAGLLKLMVQYVELPRCVAGSAAICSSQAVVNRLRDYEKAADIATKGAVDIARAPTKTAVALANAVSDANRAIDVFRNAVAAVKPEARNVQ